MENNTRYNVLRTKTENFIEIIMKEMNINRDEATKLWYNLKTKKELRDSPEYQFVSVARCFDELEMELNNDPHWLMWSFE